VCLCVGHTGKLCKTAEPIEMSFEGLTVVGQKNHVFDGGPDTSTGGAFLRETCVGAM